MVAGAGFDTDSPGLEGEELELEELEAVLA